MTCRTYPIMPSNAAIKARVINQLHPAANAEQALSKLAFAVREIANLDRTEWSEDQLHRFRLLVSEADRLAGLIEGEKRNG